jgi:hypothetical protein
MATLLFSILQLPILSTHESDAESNKNMDIERFSFLFASLAFSIDTSSTLSSDQQAAAMAAAAALSAFFYIAHHPATNTSLNKRRSVVHVKKEFFSFCCQSPTTHTHT